jgi:hypothetical protein
MVHFGFASCSLFINPPVDRFMPLYLLRRKLIEKAKSFFFSYVDTENGRQKLSGQFKIFCVGRLAGTSKAY